MQSELDLLTDMPDLEHVVSLRASYTAKGQLSLVIKPWGQTDLQSFLARPEALPAWKALSDKPALQGQMLVGWMSCLATALAELHARSYKHKDVKPANILLVVSESKPGVVHPCFCDFGLSKKFGEVSKSAGSGGTLFYRSPEQVAGTSMSGRAADVFSLGCVFLELAYMLAAKKRKCLSMELHKDGYASSEFISNKGFVKVLPHDSAMWASLTEILAGMLEWSARERMTAAEVSQRIGQMEAAAGRKVHCCFQPPPAGPSTGVAGESSAESSPLKGECPSDSDDEEGTPLLT